jgi:hypothetical protein
MTDPTAPAVLELFAGIGGMSLGLERVTGQPYEADVRAYIADCQRHRSQLDPKYHPTADGAVKMIPHNGNAEAAEQIRQTFTALTSPAATHDDDHSVPGVAGLADLPGIPVRRYSHPEEIKEAPSGLTIEAAALGYMRLGWPVFVLGRSKRPIGNCAACKTAGPGHDPAGCGCLTCHGFYAATLDPGRLAAMLRKVPGGLLAIRTGTVSGLCVVDVDPRNGGRIDKTLMTPTATVATGGGG